MSVDINCFFKAIDNKHTIKPEFFSVGDNCVEQCKNKSVIETINEIVKNVDDSLNKLNDAIDASGSEKFSENTDLCVYLIERIIESIDVSEITNGSYKAQTMFMHILTKNNSKLLPFIKTVYNYYEHLLKNKTGLSIEACQSAENLTNVAFSSECMCDGKHENMDPRTWITKRIELYTPGVNFEHVCMMVDLMINNMQAKDKNVLYPFLYFLRFWINDKYTIGPFIYHYMKLIRVYIYGINKDKFNPLDTFTNVRFGNRIDRNVEIYGDVRLSSDFNDVFSMFSLTPRTKPVKYSDDNGKRLFFNWNKLYPIVATFTSSVINLSKTIDRKNLKFSKTFDLADYLTRIDLTPRTRFIKHNIGNSYITQRLDHIESEENNWSLAVFGLLREFCRRLEFPRTPFALNYYKYSIYVTYTDKVQGVITVPLNKTLEDLYDICCVHKNVVIFEKNRGALGDNFVKKCSTRVTERGRKDYIPSVDVNFEGYVQRSLCVKQDDFNEWTKERKQYVPPSKAELQHRCFPKKK